MQEQALPAKVFLDLRGKEAREVVREFVQLVRQHGRMSGEVNEMRDRLALRVVEANEDHLFVHGRIGPLRMTIAIEGDFVAADAELRGLQVFVCVGDDLDDLLLEHADVRLLLPGPIVEFQDGAVMRM